MNFGSKPRPPKPTPTPADPSVRLAGTQADQGYQSLIATTPTGLSRKPNTRKASLIGGSIANPG